VILTGAAGERREIDLVPPAPAGVTAAALPVPVCPAGIVEGLGTAEAEAEPPAPGTSPLDEMVPPGSAAEPPQEGGQS
jgi:hypothetical protein